MDPASAGRIHPEGDTDLSMTVSALGNLMVDGWYEVRGHGKGDDAESVFGFVRRGRVVLNSASNVLFSVPG